jgi:hypothetical protein
MLGDYPIRHPGRSPRGMARSVWELYDAGYAWLTTISGVFVLETSIYKNETRARCVGEAERRGVESA